MAGWLWVVAAVVLGVVIFLLLRSRGGTGGSDHRRGYRAAGRGRSAIVGSVEDVEVREDVEEVGLGRPRPS